MKNDIKNNNPKAPFTKEQVENLNKFQQNHQFHPFTCGSPKEAIECERTTGKGEGILIATTNGWICPCGVYTQNWAFQFMAEPLSE